MSYDLFFTPRAGSIGPEQFAEYFSARVNYKVDLPQAWYENEETGVYFVMEVSTEREANAEDGPFYPVSLNVNYFRPSYFILEAEPEITEFVGAFDLVVSDPQAFGMSDGTYDREHLISGWQRGNEAGYAAILRDPKNYEALRTLPTAVLTNAWRWNFNRNRLQAELGESRFVPRVMLILHSGRPATGAVWPDGIPIAVPQVDYLIVPRKELAPRRLLRRSEDRTLLAWRDAVSLFEKYRSSRVSEYWLLDYEEPTPEVRQFVESLPSDTSDIEGIAPDQVLDRELVEKHLPR